MKYIWEESDIEVGRYFYQERNLNHIGSLAGSTYKIGYLSIDGEIDIDKKYVSISVTDGIVFGPFSKSSFVKMLNDNSYVPAKQDKLLEVFSSLRKLNEGV